MCVRLSPELSYLAPPSHYTEKLGESEAQKVARKTRESSKTTPHSQQETSQLVRLTFIVGRFLSVSVSLEVIHSVGQMV